MSRADTDSSSSVPRLTEHLFRQEAGKLVSMLTGIFGVSRLQLAEDVVQDALIRALQTWPYYGIPENPAAWLLQAAKHRAIDVIRREKLFHEKEQSIIATLEQHDADTPSPHFADEIEDNRLRLIFACCHPQIPVESQTALALKTLCGLSPSEIAHAFLSSEAAIAKRLTRARQRISELGLPFEIPAGEELAPRLEGVLNILYLLFNEGYKASTGDHLLREELCYEAMRLTQLLAQHPKTDTPCVHALLALMLLTSARMPTRMDAAGRILRLQEQDRQQWDHAMIHLGLQHLAASAQGERLSEYHLQAGIAACHAMAPDYASTDWPRILAHYAQWMRINDSPIIALNRAVALAQISGPQAGLAAIQSIREQSILSSYYLTHAILGELEARQNNFRVAALHFQKALQLSEVKSEQDFLSQRLQAILPQI